MVQEWPPPQHLEWTPLADDGYDANASSLALPSPDENFLQSEARTYAWRYLPELKDPSSTLVFVRMSVGHHFRRVCLAMGVK